MDNDALVAALLADRDRYMGEIPIVPSPEAIIVSGDLIQGTSLGQPHWQKVMSEQYRIAEEFLNHLTLRFLDGDRSKLIIVPGNHDVCWNTAISSMLPVPESEYPSDVRQALIEPGSMYRWSWKDLCLYQIQDTNLYCRRMGAYWEFAERFYEGVQFLMPIDRNRDYQLFELHDRKIVVAAFSSITGNDCLSYSGALPPGAVARCELKLRDIPHSYDLRIAVWHHSIHGPPLRDDYMQVEQIQEMAGLRFQLGIHGHQHVAAATTQYIHLSERQSMAIVSAGSLCAGLRELPRGVNRQYNLIVVEDDLRRARVHVREMVEGEQFSRKSNGAFSQGFLEISWQTSTDIMGHDVDAREQNIRRTTLEAENALLNGHEHEVFELLHDVELSPGSHARKIAIRAAVKLEDWERLISALDQPQSIEEAVLLISGLIRMNDLDRAADLLSTLPDIDGGTRNELEGQIKTKRVIRPNEY